MIMKFDIYIPTTCRDRAKEKVTLFIFPSFRPSICLSERLHSFSCASYNSDNYRGIFKRKLTLMITLMKRCFAYTNPTTSVQAVHRVVYPLFFYKWNSCIGINFDANWEIFKKLETNVQLDKMVCRVHEQ